MDTNIPGSKPQLYQRVRLALLIILGLQVILTPFATMAAVSEIEKTETQATTDVVKMSITILWSFVLLVILFFIMGFVGVLREHYCMTKGFAVTMTVFNLLALLSILKMDLAQLVSYIFCWVMTAMAYYVAKESVKYNGAVVYA
ncbi:hypothetical protein HDE_07741 [Halotydeus destructor]|nr:hypothetical protein HDE_07741 [Halotydeus destructor]